MTWVNQEMQEKPTFVFSWPQANRDFKSLFWCISYMPLKLFLSFTLQWVVVPSMLTYVLSALFPEREDVRSHHHVLVNLAWSWSSAFLAFFLVACHPPWISPALPSYSRAFSLPLPSLALPTSPPSPLSFRVSWLSHPPVLYMANWIIMSLPF